MNTARNKFWPKNRRLSLISLVVVLIGAVRIVVIWQVAFERTRYELEEATRHEFLQNANLAVAIEEHTDRTLKSVGQAFNLVEQEYRNKGASTDLTGLLADGGFSFQSFSHLAVINEWGFVAAGPDNPVPVNVSDRDYFKHHQAVDSKQLFVAKPAYGRVSGKWAIHVTRRINKPDGSFGGVVIGAIEPAYFTDFYLKTDVGDHGTVSLIGLDGIVRARRVGTQTTIATDVTRGTLLAAQARQPEGSLLGEGRVDGVVRLFSYRTLKDYPLFVAVGTSRAEAFGPVFQRQKNYYTAATLATLTVLVIGALLVWLLQRQQALLLAMRKTQALQRASFNLAAIGMAHIDLDGRYLRVNDKLCSMLGCSESELPGTPVYDQVFPADRDAYQLFFENLRADPERHLSSTLEIRYLHKDGSLIWTLASVSIVLKIADSESYFISALQDITDRKRSALALQERNKQVSSAFENSAVGMALTAPDGRWLKVNRSLCQMLGYTEAELMSRNFQEITHPDDLATSLQNVQQLLGGVSHALQVEKRYVHKQGHPVWAALGVSLVRDEDGQPLHFIAQVQDISQRKQAQSEIKRLNAELEERVRQRTRELQFATQEIAGFSYSVAHDLRQPLGSIMGFSDLLERELSQQTSERSRHCLARIRAGVSQIGDLTDALLSLVKLSNIHLRWENVDLSMIAKNLVEGCARLEPLRKANFHIHNGLQAAGDPQLLAVVMDNLIGNAWKFSSKMAQTDIEIGSERGPDQETIYFVRDQGAGFDMAYAEKLFGNFQRLHAPSEFAGNGIGLASAHRIITRHGGRIWAQSAPGQGATFYFTVGAAPQQTLFTPS